MADRTRRWIVGRVFDAGLGTRTAAISPGDRGIVPQELEYQPSDLRKIHCALRALQLGSDDVVIDYGAGLGRVVLAVSKYTSARTVIGIEHQAELYERAAKNLSAARPKLRCQDVRIEYADARKFEVPDDVTVAYLFNPFAESSLQEVGNRIMDSLERVPRKLAVVYNNPPPWSRVWVDLGFEREVLEQRLHLYRWSPTAP
jgi:tRNA A58 N-methylase Trm61